MATGNRTPSSKLEGVDYTRSGPISGTRNRIQRGKRKLTLAELESRWEAVERSHAASCEIRKRAGLPAVEPSFWTRALYAELEARRPADELAPRRKVAKSRKAPQAPAREARRADSEAPDVFRMLRAELEALGTPEAVAELERRRAKREAKRSRLAA